MLAAKNFRDVKQEYSPLEVEQAVNYANSKGIDWVVLTNGRTWDIYNVRLTKPITEKCVMQIGDLFLDANGAEKLLLLSRQSMQNGDLTRAWTHQCIAAMVKRELETPNSPIRDHLCRIGSKEIGAELGDAAITRAIADYRINSIRPEPGSVVPPQPPTVNSVPNESSHADFYTFEEIAKDRALATHSKAKTIKFLDGRHEEVYHWADVAKVVVEWIGQTYRLPPIPFSTGHQGKNYFLNSVPLQSDGKEMEQRRVVQVRGKRIYIDTKKDVQHIAGNLAHLLVTIGKEPNTVIIRLSR